MATATERGTFPPHPSDQEAQNLRNRDAGPEPAPVTCCCRCTSAWPSARRPASASTHSQTLYSRSSSRPEDSDTTSTHLRAQAGPGTGGRHPEARPARLRTQGPPVARICQPGSYHLPIWFGAHRAGQSQLEPQTAFQPGLRNNGLIIMAQPSNAEPRYPSIYSEGFTTRL